MKKALLIDFTNIAYQILHRHVKEIKHEDITNEYKAISFKIISEIINYKRNYNVCWHDVNVCFDTKTNWRRDKFEHYKANRKTARSKSNIDFTLFYKFIDDFYNDCKKYMPFKCFRVELAEADDIIGILAKRLKRKIIIISRDKDFLQLQKYPNVIKQFDPVKQVNIKSIDTLTEITVKIMNGDRGDGVPNMLSDDDSLVNILKKQKRLGEVTATKILLNKGITNYLNEVSEEVKLNYIRNDMMINLDNIPKDIDKDIVNCYTSYEINKDKDEVTNFIIKSFGRGILSELI